MHWKKLFEGISQQPGIILTPNRRLSAYLRTCFDQYQLTQQRSSWASISIMPYISWLNTLWQQHYHLHPDAFLLNAFQRQTLWEKCVRQAQSDYSLELLQASHTAELAQKAWQLIQQWHIPVTEAEFTRHEDNAFFYHCLRLYTQALSQCHAVDPDQLYHHLSLWLNQGRLKLPDTLYLLGFDEVNPAQKTFLDLCRQHACKIEILNLTLENNRQSRVATTNTEAEILLMARWAKAQHALNPQSQIGCVIPNLAVMRRQISDIFARVFAGEHYLVTDSSQLPYNISAGDALSRQALIFSALKLLELNQTSLPLETLSFLLRTPFCKAYWEESDKRAALDKHIKTLGLLELSRAYFKNLVEQHCPLFAKSLNLVWQSPAQEKLSFNEWAQLFSWQLYILGWPGKRELNSEEYQVFSRFQALLSDYASLDYVSPKIKLTVALTRLHKLTHDTLFQKQSEAKPIQILGSLEAAGIIFDKLWISGMDNHTLPQAAKPHPFIPLALQKKYAIPHATAERELQFAQNLLTRFQQSSQEIIYSYPLQEQDRHLQPSQLISDITEITPEELVLADYEDPALTLFNTRKTESVADENAPPLTSEELAQLQGGAKIFESQSACPFQAFANFRLGIKTFEKPDIGLSAKDRGIIVHACLEKFWQRVETQENLLKLETAALLALIEACVTAAIAEIKPYMQSGQPQFYALEKTRLSAMMREWLSCEAERPPFTVVATEQQIKAAFAEIPLRLRIDRIDQLDDGAYLLIDYKTGDKNIQSWLEERLDEPQLPLYCVLNQTPVQGIAFGQVAVNKFQFKGISQYPLHIKGIHALADKKKISWEAQLENWQSQLTTLAQAFANGDAKPDPKEAPNTCNFCKLHCFCRINERLIS